MASRLLASLLSRAPKLSPASTPKPALPTAFSHPLRLLSLTARLTAAAHLLWTYGICVGPAEGPSMLPTFAVTNQLLLTSRLHRHGRSVRVGDLVVYRIPIFAAPGADGVKRVLGMPGDYVLIDSPDGGSGGMIQVPQGHCWLVGDNLPASRDSRTFGPVPLALIRGKVIASLWPLWEFRWIRNPLENHGWSNDG